MELFVACVSHWDWSLNCTFCAAFPRRSLIWITHRFWYFCHRVPCHWAFSCMKPTKYVRLLNIKLSLWIESTLLSITSWHVFHLHLGRLEHWSIQHFLQYNVHCHCNYLAVFLLQFSKSGHRSHIKCSKHCLRFTMVWCAPWCTKMSHFDYGKITKSHLLHGLRFDSLYIAQFRNGK